MEFFCAVFAIISVVSELIGPSLQHLGPRPTWSNKPLDENEVVRDFCDNAKQLPAGVWSTPVGKCHWKFLGN
ncbi:unnamed protein product [Cylicocyclus nassatus]|uniref:Secreted protein n=1 Tax=Cylicocyclus nassatus TaxID=53992 RepID=A0AA36DNI3_CYLNA|nr:unnamed protein product [Cylicocyclus nassatus]